MARQASRGPADHDRAPAANAPSPERLRQGPVERLDRPIADDAGVIGRPHRAVDTLTVMERRGSITPAMRQAGEDFRADFTIAQLDPLRAVDWTRLRLGRAPGCRDDQKGLRVETARQMVWRAILAVGGLGSPGGSCLWHVVGWQRSLKEWALEQGWAGRRISQESASGILIAALGALEAHYRQTGTLRKSNFPIDKSGSL